MRVEDAEQVSHVTNLAFFDSVAPGLSEEGINTFLKISAPQSIALRMQGDNIIYVYENNGVIEGVVELKEGRHVAMLFVMPSAQGQGIGRALIKEALNHAREMTVTVSASIPSVPAYIRYGFKVVDTEKNLNGLRYVPMVYQFKPHV